jgi:carboxylesterase type B
LNVVVSSLTISLDCDYLTEFPSALTAHRQFIKVPIIIGANSDEGVSFSAKQVKTDSDIAVWLKTWRSYNLSMRSIEKLVALYEDYDYPPYLVNRTVHFTSTGAKWRKSGAIGGDLVMVAQRRKVAQAWSSASGKAWSFRFDTPMWNATDADGTKHSSQVVFTLGNNTGLLGPLSQFQHYKTLSDQIVAAYVRFVNRFDPNPGSDESRDHPRLPYWPSYGVDAQNMVLNANKTLLEKDDWRKEGIDFINGISRELLA